METPDVERRRLGGLLSKRGNCMRNVLLAGGALVALILGGASAYANGPNSSPYEVMTFASAQQPAIPSETRASYAPTYDRSCHPGRVLTRGAWRNVQICE
jgi:poly(3-hydroxybutyrate) depolymerase